MDVVTRLLSGWARDIIVVVGLAAVVEILLPRGDFRRFAKLVMGLFVLLALTKPLLGLMQVPVTLPTATVQARQSANGFVWQETGPGSVPVSGYASLSALVETQVSQLAATSLGLQPRDVRVDVELTGKAAGWPGAISGVRLTVLRRPAAALQDCEASAIDARLDQVRQALLTQITSLYRLDPEQVQVIMPR